MSLLTVGTGVLMGNPVSYSYHWKPPTIFTFPVCYIIGNFLFLETPHYLTPRKKLSNPFGPKQKKNSCSVCRTRSFLFVYSNLKETNIVFQNIFITK